MKFYIIDNMIIYIQFLNRVGDNRSEIYKMISNIVYKLVWENYLAMHRLKLQIRYQIYLKPLTSIFWISCSFQQFLYNKKFIFYVEFNGIQFD